ncbi:MAG: FAD-dependent oxidoreductase [Pseudoxanthomonas sp.]
MSRSKSWQFKWLALLALAGLLAWLWYSGLLGQLTLANLKAHQTAIAGQVQAHPWLTAGAYFVIYVLATAASIPEAFVLTLAGGALFGLVEGLALVSFASSIGATLAFLASRTFLRDSVRRRYGERLKSFDAGIARDGAFYLFSLRLVPAVPFVLINLLAGLTALPVRTFYWVSQLGMLPGTLVFVYAGTQLAQIESASDVLSPGLIGALVALGLLPLCMRWLLRRLDSRRKYAGHNRPAHFDYNLVVIGAGSAGLVSAYIGAAVNAKVALIERHRMGGDCLNTGCVPSKALIRSARALADARNSRDYGIASMQASFEFAEIMERVQQVIRKVEPHDSVQRYSELGVEVITGDARIVSPWEVQVGDRRISARSLVIATGARPLVPSIPGLDEVEYLTSDTLWGLRELPGRLLVLGGGPIGCELAQSFARFGSAVTMVEMAPRLLPREDADAAVEVESNFRAEGIVLAAAHKALRVEKDGSGGRLICEFEGNEVSFAFDRLLLALGRKANIEGFGLEELGIEVSKRGTIEADGLMRTNFPNIHVCGDVTGPYQFTHVAAHQAWHASINALLAPFWSFKISYRVIPWATFCSPEVARVGLSEDEAAEQEIAVEVTKFGFEELDRAIADGSAHGFVKVLTIPGKDTILGACIVGDHAGDLLAEFVLAMKHGIGMNKLLGTIHTYPTMAEANKSVAGAWKKAHAPEAALRWAGRFFKWRRS